ncbi:MAG TPA: hypothetical protein PK260_01885 [Candidatus Moranbacteria bacterium]|jgi:hypothetical protein|nr:hypothetical protein [Candidatus Moranbacteria bacterium]HOF42234.1 hypothetical protein [Candidatus Moranbacteria bacterium]HQB59496.1 hypothetical protein [Candidatus Moranbacteria bacterium]
MYTRTKIKRVADIKATTGGSKRVDLRRDEAFPVLFSRGKKSRHFYTEDSKLYITPREQQMMRNGIKINRSVHMWDSANSRIVADFMRYCPNGGNSSLVKILEKRSADLCDSLAEVSQNFVRQFSLVRLWNLSIVGSILFGMVLMTFVYKYLGQGAAANQIAVQNAQAVQGQVLGVEAEVNEKEFTSEFMEIENADEKTLEKEIREMVKGFPIENMVPYIAEKDRTVAAFIVGIAKKESAWGKRRPVLNGQDCYNYWGYRGKRMLMGSGGHTCFNSPKDAVDTVAKRIETLVKKYDRNTPAKMVVWKCGSDCEATGGEAAARKWISDVSLYFNKLNYEEEEK